MQLPTINELGFFEIRLESIGGLGANLAGKMLAEAGVVGEGMNGVSFSSYGSEKKGSPVKAHIRFCDLNTPIRDTSPVEHPHLVGIFHEALAKTVHVTSGITADSYILVNSAKSPEELKKLLGLPAGTVAVVDATLIALEGKNRVNMAMLGGLFRLCPFLDPSKMKSVIEKSLGKKYPQAVQSAITTFERGYNKLTVQRFDLPEGEAMPAFIRSGTPLLGYETQPLGGSITNPGTNFLKDLSISRSGFIPRYDSDSCIHCAECDTVCPDMCFVWEKREGKNGKAMMFLQGIDYQYCKGCLKCVEVCPTSALHSIREQDGFAEANTSRHTFDQVNQI